MKKILLATFIGFLITTSLHAQNRHRPRANYLNIPSSIQYELLVETPNALAKVYKGLREYGFTSFSVSIPIQGLESGRGFNVTVYSIDPEIDIDELQKATGALHICLKNGGTYPTSGFNNPNSVEEACTQNKDPYRPYIKKEPVEPINEDDDRN